MKHIAFIGTREPRLVPSPIASLFQRAAASLAREGRTIASGATPGAEQLAVEEALAAGGRVRLFLPWVRFESAWVRRLERRCPGRVQLTVFDPREHREWLECARSEHPQGEQLSMGSLALLARSHGMLRDASAVIAMPYVRIAERIVERSERPRRGRVGGVEVNVEVRDQVQARGIAELPLRLARLMEVQCFDLSDPEHREHLQAVLDGDARLQAAGSG